VGRIAIVGNVSRDVVDGGPPRPGGCPTYAVQALRLLGRPAQIVTRCAEADRPFFEPALRGPEVEVNVLPGQSTAAFELSYDGSTRAMTVTSIGDTWTSADADRLAEDIHWVHVAPLSGSDFTPDALAAFASGRRLSLDGQGLVREPGLGALRQTAQFDVGLLEHVTVLKLAEEEAELVAGGPFEARHAAALGVDVVLVTRGERGADVWVNGEVTHVRTKPVAVETTGAGDAFAVAYIAGRDRGASPVAAARGAVALVRRLLEERRAPK
jgi:sugar/nucleoside kinase (ribokinase family)